MWASSRGTCREEERLRGDLRHLGEKEDNGRDWRKGKSDRKQERLWFDGADWLFSALLQSATVRPHSEHDPPLWDGDTLGSPRCIDSQAHSFGRIRIDETCLRPRFIYLFIWCLLWSPAPSVWEYGATYRGPAAPNVQAWQLIWGHVYLCVRKREGEHAAGHLHRAHPP